MLMRTLIAIPLVLALVGCARSTSALKPVEGFELDRYSGRWYEIARFPHRFERGLIAVTAEYTVQKDGSVRVENRGYNPARKSWKTASGRAHFKGDRSTGLLRVSFFWPFYGDYKIIRLDKTGYAYAVVTGSTYDYFWILSRTPTLDEKTLAELMTFAKVSGFDTSKIEFPDQAMNASAK